ncbi:hypothetical protein ThrDRAFT_01536 [Frankia casuarinae]|nr:hypothetical protein ThrDRAFT_01536 [Frankia casuarinae]KDA42056.1 hypothetical protein BMG523Draft_03067 [Frankia sp. BMG5.23]
MPHDPQHGEQHGDRGSADFSHVPSADLSARPPYHGERFARAGPRDRHNYGTTGRPAESEFRCTARMWPCQPLTGQPPEGKLLFGRMRNTPFCREKCRTAQARVGTGRSEHAPRTRTSETATPPLSPDISGNIVVPLLKSVIPTIPRTVATPPRYPLNRNQIIGAHVPQNSRSIIRAPISDRVTAHLRPGCILSTRIHNLGINPPRIERHGYAAAFPDRALATIGARIPRARRL